MRTATCNAAALGFADRAVFFAGDWGAAVSGRFDAVVANPPYVVSRDLPLLPREVALHDPWRALDGGEDGLWAYRAMAADLPSRLAPNGIFVGEVGVGVSRTVIPSVASGAQNTATGVATQGGAGVLFYF